MKICADPDPISLSELLTITNHFVEDTLATKGRLLNDVQLGHLASVLMDLNNHKVIKPLYGLGALQAYDSDDARIVMGFACLANDRPGFASGFFSRIENNGRYQEVLTKVESLSLFHPRLRKRAKAAEVVWALARPNSLRRSRAAAHLWKWALVKGNDAAAMIWNGRVLHTKAMTECLKFVVAVEAGCRGSAGATRGFWEFNT